MKNASKLFAKYLEDKICKIKKNTKYNSNPKNIFKSTKNFLEKLNPNCSKTVISKVLNKIPNRKKTSKQ